MTVNLSKFVGKRVRVTFENGSSWEGSVSLGGSYLYPYSILWDNHSRTYYDRLGCLDSVVSTWGITEIEELEMSNYEELERKVAEMQAEIDRLKAQERKVRTFREDIREILSQFYATANHYELYEDYTDKICEVVKGYIPGSCAALNASYNTGYNIALYKVRQNLGLDK